MHINDLSVGKSGNYTETQRSLVERATRHSIAYARERMAGNANKLVRLVWGFSTNLQNDN